MRQRQRYFMSKHTNKSWALFFMLFAANANAEYYSTHSLTTGVSNIDGQVMAIVTQGDGCQKVDKDFNEALSQVKGLKAVYRNLKSKEYLEPHRVGVSFVLKEDEISAHLNFFMFYKTLEDCQKDPASNMGVTVGPGAKRTWELNSKPAPEPTLFQKIFGK